MANILSEKKLSGKLILALIFTACALLVRFGGLTERPVWYDEAITIFNAQSSFESIWQRFAHGSNPPFAYFFYHVWQNLFGTSQLSYELVSVVFGTLSVFLIFKTGKLLFDTETGLIAAVLIAFSSYHVFVSQQIRGYAMACFFALLSIYALFKFFKFSKQRDFVLWLVSAVLMMSTHFYTGFLFAVEVLAWRIASSKVKNGILFYACGGALILLAAIAGIQLIRILNIFPFYPRPHARLGDLMLVLQSVFFLSKPLVIASVLLVIWRFKDFRGNGRLQFLLAWFAVSLAVPFAISRFVPSFFYVRYYIFTHLAWVLMTAFAIRQIPRGTVRLLAVAAFVFFLSFMIADYYQESREKSKFKTAIEMIAQDYREGDVIVHENGWTFGTSYYYHSGKLPEFYLTDEFAVPTLERFKISPEKIQNYKRMWLVLERPESVPIIESFPWYQNLLKQMVKQMPEFQLYLFDLNR